MLTEDLRIPPNIKQAIDDYVEHGYEPGGFTTAVLANDLMEAMKRADLDSRYNLFAIVYYVYMHTPANCHGSYEIVRDWIAAKKQQRGD